MRGRQTKGPDGVTALVLSEDLKRSAQALVQAYDALPWDDLKEYELTTVRLLFTKADEFRKAKDLLLFIVCSYPESVRSVMEKFEDILSQQLVPVFDLASRVIAKSAATDQQRKLLQKLASFKRMLTRYREVMEQFRPQIRGVVSPQRASRLWVSLNEILEAIQPVRSTVLAIIRGTTTDLLTSYPPEMNLPIDPVWIAPLSGEWIDVPLNLFLGDQIVGFCRRIVGVNTELVQLPILARVRTLSEKYHVLFNECGLSRFEIPYEGACPERTGHLMQKGVEVAFKALHDLSKHLNRRTWSAEILRHEQPHDEGVPSASGLETDEVAPPTESKRAEQPKQTTRADAGDGPVCVLVKEDGAIEVRDKRVRRGSSMYRILLILALIQKRSGSEYAVVDRNEFLNLYGSKAEDPGKAFYKLFEPVKQMLGFSPLEEGRLQYKLRLRFNILALQTKLQHLIRGLRKRRSQYRV
jgi:hypothetical protein